MDKSNSESYSLKSVSAPLSVRSETKEKFEAILKEALDKKKSKTSQSKQNLLNSDDDDDSTTASSSNLLDKDLEKLSVDEEQTKSYILNKFLNNGKSDTVNNDEFIKPPVPKPRRHKLKKTVSDSSHGTFEVTSPRVLKKVEKSSVSTNKTYDVVQKEEKVSPKSLVGDVILHESHRSPSILILNVKDCTVNSSDNESHVSAPEKNKPESVELKALKKNKNHTETSYNYEKITEIVIHKTDKLKLNSFVVHPIVKVHIVDINTGKYFPKSCKNRSVVFFYENKEFEYISPVMTHVFNLQEQRSIYPMWEETILLNEDFNYFIDESKNIVIFFELLDFGTFTTVHATQSQKGWHNIAFAFIKLAGGNNDLNLNKKLRLQLYYRGKSGKKEEPHNCAIWSYWKKSKLTKYPSTLYVTIKSVTSPQTVIDTFRSKTPVQGERGSFKQHFQNAQSKSPTIGTTGEDQTRGNFENSETQWSKQPSANCQLPNKLLTKFPCYDEGCFVLKFSNNGLYLAAALRIQDVYTLVVYCVKTYKEVKKFACHQGLIYNISWSSDDVVIVTASADNTVSVCNFKTLTFLQILPHPSFVYATDISREYSVATGCYDKVLRIWCQTNSKKFDLFQELIGHKGYVTCLRFDSKSVVLYSADSVGEIVEWYRYDDDWKLNRELKIFDLKNTVINEILLISKEKKLVVHSRDSTIRIVDIKSACVLHWLHGALNRRVQTFCTVTPCENYILSGSENGLVNIWNLKTNNHLGNYVPFSGHGLPVHCVRFHPLDNIIAISHYGGSFPILLLGYDKDVKDNQVGLKITVEKEVLYTELQRNHTLTLSKHIKSANVYNNKINLKSILNKMDEVMTASKKQT